MGLIVLATLSNKIRIRNPKTLAELRTLDKAIARLHKVYG